MLGNIQQLCGGMHQDAVKVPFLQNIKILSKSFTIVEHNLKVVPYKEGIMVPVPKKGELVIILWRMMEMFLAFFLTNGGHLDVYNRLWYSHDSPKKGFRKTQRKYYTQKINP